MVFLLLYENRTKRNNNYALFVKKQSCRNRSLIHEACFLLPLISKPQTEIFKKGLSPSYISGNNFKMSIELDVRLK